MHGQPHQSARGHGGFRHGRARGRTAGLSRAGALPVTHHLGVVFGMIAGAMVFLSLDELLPAAKRYAKGHETVYGMVIGMAVLALSLVLFR